MAKCSSDGLTQITGFFIDQDDDGVSPKVVLMTDEELSVITADLLEFKEKLSLGDEALEHGSCGGKVTWSCCAAQVKDELAHAGCMEFTQFGLQKCGLTFTEGKRPEKGDLWGQGF